MASEVTVVVNSSPLQFPPCGVRVYTDSLIRALRSAAGGAHLVCHDFTLRHPAANRAGRALHRLLGDRWYLALKARVSQFGAGGTLLPRPEQRVIYHETNNVPPVDVGLPYLTTVHDLSVFRFPAYHPPYRVRFFTEHFDRTLNSTMITVPSQATRRDLQRDFGVPEEKVVVVPYGRDEFFQPMDRRQAWALAGKYVGGPFILFSGVIEPRKNIEALLSAFTRVRRSHKLALVLAGTFGWQHEALLRLPSRMGVPDVCFTGRIAADDVRALYNCAEVFVYPSYHEGFGFPPLEAMACGVPVVLSRTSSLPEVGGDAAVYVDPTAVDGIAEGILRVLDDGQLRQMLRRLGLARSRQFSWHDTAARMMTLYAQVAQQHPTL